MKNYLRSIRPHGLFTRSNPAVLSLIPYSPSRDYNNKAVFSKQKLLKYKKWEEDDHRFSNSNTKTKYVIRTTRKLYYLLGFSGLSYTGYYYYSNLEKVAVSGRTRFNDTSPEKELTNGNIAYASIMSKFAGSILPNSHPHSRLVHSVARKLIAHADVRPPVHWEVHVVDVPVANAFILPGGKIFVFTGLLSVAGNTDGLAAVIAHEIGHQIAHHAAETLSKSKMLMIGQFLASIVFNDTRWIFQSGVMETVFLRPFSRNMESEADFIGLLLMNKAGFRMEEAAVVMSKMASSGFEFASTHPSSESRVRNIGMWIEGIRKGQVSFNGR